MVKHTYKFLKVCLTIYYVIFLYSFLASQGISLWACFFFEWAKISIFNILYKIIGDRNFGSIIYF